ncbi:MAG: glycosyltransferase family 87 protein [Rhodospirillales bacterium]
MLAALRDANWLTARAGSRLRRHPGAAAAGVRLRGHSGQGAPGGAEPAPFTGGHGFPAVLHAGRLARAGLAVDAYRLEVLTKAEQEAAVVQGGSLPFLYPPPILLLCAAVAGLPFAIAWLAFEAAGLVPLVLALRRLLPQRWALLPLLTAPAVLMNLGSGQTGFYTAASFAWAAVLLDRRPALAGAALGVLVAKPHLAVLVPVALFRGAALAGGPPPVPRRRSRCAA